eukprot:1157945-Pelagomonas_calceolata.AAC.5
MSTEGMQTTCGFVGVGCGHAGCAYAHGIDRHLRSVFLFKRMRSSSKRVSEAVALSLYGTRCMVISGGAQRPAVHQEDDV